MARAKRELLGLTAWDLARMSQAERIKAFEGVDDEKRRKLERFWPFRIMPGQVPPSGDWRVWLLMAGRGFGKTRTGAEWVRGIAETDGRARIALVAATMAEARSVMVEGDSGLLAIAPAARRPLWEPSQRRLRWRSGAVARLFAASEPEGLRGPQHSHAWCDEIGKWPYGIETWDNLAMGLRLGDRPRIVATTTPRPVPLVKMLVARGDVAVTGGRTEDNRDHLAADFFDAMESTYAGTRLGRQELDGELIEEAEGALWRRDLIERCRVRYPPEDQDYFTGFVLDPADAATQWPRIAGAVGAARGRGVTRIFVWALPQVARDGFTCFLSGEGELNAFDDIDFPLALGAHASVTPGFSTAIVTTAAGVEQRNADWADARLRFDAGRGVRSEADIATLLAFFRARRGAARAFRFRDPFDYDSGGDQPIGTGDGVATSFALTKSYGADDPQVRTITRPVAGSVSVALGGEPLASGWSLLDGGIVSFEAAPAVGVAITARFAFDVPVRFAEDTLEVGLSTFLAGEAPSVPLVEVRE